MKPTGGVNGGTPAEEALPPELEGVIGDELAPDELSAVIRQAEEDSRAVRGPAGPGGKGKLGKGDGGVTRG